MGDRATKDEVLGRLENVAHAMTSAIDALARRYGSSEQVRQMAGALAMITKDWVPTIKREKAP